MILCLLIAALIIVTAFSYVNLTRDLPSAQILPTLLNPPDGLLLQPTRIYDRTGKNVIYTFAPDDAPRRYIPLSETNPQHLPKSLADAVIARTDPQFWGHQGYSLAGLANPESHPTIAQKLVYVFILFDEPPSLRRALRERILAAQITAEFGRTQVLEWYLNSAHFGHYAFGAEAAAQLYFGKPAAQLTTAESAILAGVSDSPSLNPYDAPETAPRTRRGDDPDDVCARAFIGSSHRQRAGRISALSNSASRAAGSCSRFRQPAPGPIGFPIPA